MALWGVDFYSSLHDCLLNLWPAIVDRGFVILDEYRDVPYCSVFYSQKYRDKYFTCAPPGLIGIGTGVQVGMYYTNPSAGMGMPRIQGPESMAYCRKEDPSIWEIPRAIQARCAMDENTRRDHCVDLNQRNLLH